MGKTQKETALWMVLTQGSGLALCVYFVGLMGLSALLVKGTVGEGSAFAAVAGLCAAASFLGALVTVRRTPWGSAAAGLVTGAIFAAALALAGLACWGTVVLGRGGVLAAGALVGGLGAGLLGGRKRGKRTRRRKGSL